MRVLCVTNMYPSAEFPASGTFIHQQIQGLRELGLDLDLLYVARREKGMKCYAEVARRLRKHLAEAAPELVHVMYGGIMAKVVSETVTHRPVVVTFHGSDLLGEPSAGVVRRLLAWAGVRASLQAALRAAGVVVVSEGVRRALPANLPAAKVQVIPCGIDLDRFRPLDRRACRERLQWSPDRFHVLFQDGNGAPVKRPALARAAIAAARARGLDAELHVLRGVPNEEVPIWLNASAVVLLTSLHEGSPMIVKEALACDRPIVSVDVGDVAERLRGIQGCYLARPEAADLADKLLLVSEGPSSVRGRETLTELSLHRVAVRLKEFYEATVQQWQPGLLAATCQPARV
ncbi:MAG: glycosyltransferase [Planctomycetes bacterium]|nr:glycosyltransferase [Planctomycetota bacterium]